ncbi:MAG TPA: hypothetical protein VFB81_08705, partial [Myxococcales bacterium]|nr:hypothetical protein [Myxococcales bacterium]
NQRLRRISAAAPHAVSTPAGDLARPFGLGDGTGLTARFRAQMGLAMGGEGELLLADTGNFRLREVVIGDNAASTHVFTIAGSGLAGTALGPGDAADLPAPAGVAVLPDGRILVSDSFHHALRAVTR